MIKEKRLAIGMALAGGAVLFLSWQGVRAIELSLEQILVAGSLTGAIILADRYPIHLLRGTKVSMVSIPIYLAVALLPIPLAVTAAGTGILLADLAARSQRGLTTADLFMNTGRWIVIGFVGCQIAHRNVSAPIDHMLLLLACAVTLLIADFISFSLSLAFVVNEPFLVQLRSTFREGFLLEGAQYLIGIIGAFAALQGLWILPLLFIPAALSYIAFKNRKELRQNTRQFLESFADTIDLRDIYTGGHSRRVAEMTSQILTYTKISGPEAELIELAARLHDIGKVAIPDEILKKDGQFTPDEYTIMKTHCQKGADLLARYGDFARGASLILYHHEYWDGNGYPDQLKGYEIPFGSRVIAVIDSFDAMTSDRPYRDAMPSRVARLRMAQAVESQFDTAVVAAFEAILASADEDYRTAHGERFVPVYQEQPREFEITAPNEVPAMAERLVS